MKLERIEVPFGAQKLIIETGKLAKQANGSVTVTVGDTVVLVTACMANKVKEDIDFFPLMVEYQEKTYAAGKIPGGFFKREGKPTESEILNSRVIDRSIRPLFPEGFYNDVQVVATVLSHDGQNDPDIPAIIGASTALTISGIPFNGPLGAVRVALIDDQLVANPTFKERENSLMDLVVVGNQDGIVMIEGEVSVIPEAKVKDALRFAFDQIQINRKSQLDLKKTVGDKTVKYELIQHHPDLVKKVRDLSLKRLTEVYGGVSDKKERENGINALFDSLISDMAIYQSCAPAGGEIKKGTIAAVYDQVQYEVVRNNVFERQMRADGRGPKDIREISCEVGVLPRTHGSSLFTRGQTQSLAVVTFGTKSDEQLIEALEGKTYRRFMLHYNFPSFSVGETKPMRGPGRREVGHGELASKAIRAILPSKEEFPYTIRVVSEILESNGSSSMASVCAGTLSLMDAGVPIKEPVAGISVGLISGEGKAVLITDIMGMEDHFGDMDFKVAGSRNGITAIQLDLKINSINVDLLEKAIDQSREARLTILDKMQATISASRPEMSPFAPRIASIQISQEKIGEVIGPGGKMIRKIIEETGVTSIDIEEDGKVLVASPDKEALDKAVNFIKGMTQEPEIGQVYDSVVKRVVNFGAFVEFLPGREGLVHVSELAKTYVKDVNEVVKVGDRFKVKLIEIDQMKRANLSKKQAE
ncbi:MAG: polyribonucleotide nucleotidyltransferase [Candidatus Omnitrophica bacterium]|nr:polyribonucleotide nucleotidyltransferase [Candidatus Omnitrophota bacterium]